jgi:hypothetical protein
MSTKRHKKDTRTFAELTFSEQAQSINATILYMKRAVLAHLRWAHKEGRNTAETVCKCERQFSSLVRWIGRNPHQ